MRTLKLIGWTVLVAFLVNAGASLVAALESARAALAQ